MGFDDASNVVFGGEIGMVIGSAPCVPVPGHAARSWKVTAMTCWVTTACGVPENLAKRAMRGSLFC
jgi:hypothetical protein